LSSKKILIADDNEGIIDILQTYLKKEGYIPVTAADGEEALELFHKHNPALLLLDVMMPKMDGFQVCRAVREVSNVPVIMITARGEDADRIMGLDIGADDYIVKPFSPGEVMARIRAVLRRVNTPEDNNANEIKIANLTVSIDSYEVKLDGRPVGMTKKEIEILWLLASNPGKVFSRDSLLNNVWGYDYFGDARTVDTHIKRLRSKINLGEHFDWDIKTIWGVGYKFEMRKNNAQ